MDMESDQRHRRARVPLRGVGLKRGTIRGGVGSKERSVEELVAVILNTNWVNGWAADP